MDDNFFKLLKLIRKNPELYLGEVSLFAFDRFWSGYITKEHEINENVKGAINLHKLQRYIEYLYELSPSSMGCSNTIRELSKNEEEAFYLFFKLLDEYVECESMLISVDCLNFLEIVRKRPTLYLGEPSFKALQHLISGFSTREEDEFRSMSRIGANLYKFQEYVENLYNFDEPSENCFALIEKIEEHDKEAFYLFFKLLDSFLENSQ